MPTCSPTAAGAGATPGLIVDGEATLLVDTLFDLPLTERMLREHARCGAGGGAHRHARQHARQRRPLLRQPARRREPASWPPSGRRRRWRSCRRRRWRRWSSRRRRWASWARSSFECFGAFDFAGIELRAAATRPSAASIDAVGGRPRALELIEVGPAHTRGDTLVHAARRAGAVQRGHPLLRGAIRSCGRDRCRTGSPRASGSSRWTSR